LIVFNRLRRHYPNVRGRTALDASSASHSYADFRYCRREDFILRQMFWLSRHPLHSFRLVQIAVSPD
jgi:hypothetical protein